MSVISNINRSHMLICKFVHVMNESSVLVSFKLKVSICLLGSLIFCKGQANKQTDFISLIKYLVSSPKQPRPYWTLTRAAERSILVRRDGQITFPPLFCKPINFMRFPGTASSRRVLYHLYAPRGASRRAGSSVTVIDSERLNPPCVAHNTANLYRIPSEGPSKITSITPHAYLRHPFFPLFWGKLGFVLNKGES